MDLTGRRLLRLIHYCNAYLVSVLFLACHLVFHFGEGRRRSNANLALHQGHQGRACCSLRMLLSLHALWISFCDMVPETVLFMMNKCLSSHNEAGSWARRVYREFGRGTKVPVLIPAVELEALGSCIVWRLAKNSLSVICLQDL